MYTKQWWPPLSFSMGSGWCAPLLSGNCCSSISNIRQNARNSIVCRHWETCNLRVTWPAGSHRWSPVEHAGCHTRNDSRYAPACECVFVTGKKRGSNASPLQWVDLIRLVDYNLSSLRAQQRIQSWLFRTRSAEKTPENKPHIALNLFTLWRNNWWLTEIFANTERRSTHIQ